MNAKEPRVEFLEQWADVEGTFDHGNRNNPLDTKMRARGAILYNAAGVKRYPTEVIGLEATISTMRQSFDHPILAALSNRRATISMLGLALAESDWTGFGPRSWNEQAYASAVSGLPASSFKLPEPTVSIHGVIVNPLQQRAAEVCVTAVRGSRPLESVITAANGNYNLTGLPRAPYRLQISDCHHVLNNPPSTFYDTKAAQYTGPLRSDATVMSGFCSMDKPCLTQNIDIRHVITFGIFKPRLTWQRPPVINYGTPVTAAQLNARASVRGTLHYSVHLGTLLDPGKHEVWVAFEPRDRAHFLPVRATQELIVDRVRPQLTWQDPAPIVAGSVLSSSELDARSSIPGTFTYSPPAGTILTPGAHPIAVRFQPNDLERYRAVTMETSVVVVPADVGA